MKKILLVFLFFCSFSVFPQLTNEGAPKSWNLFEKSSIEGIILPGIDIKKVREQDKTADPIRKKPFRIGIPHKVNYGLNDSGAWTALPNGDKIWRISFASKEAVHLSVVFDDFFLPEGSNIYLYNDEKTDLIGAYTEIENNEKNMLGSWFVMGDKLWIEYYEPKEVKGQGRLNISSVIHGYRLGKYYQKGYLNDIQKALNDSGDCNHDVDCPIGVDFETERDLLKHSVAFLNMNDGFICSGALINNTAQDRTPFFLSANHCYERDIAGGEDPANPSIFSMRFNWISPNPVCAAVTNSTNGPTNFVMSGSTLRARNFNSDVMLLELNNNIATNWNVTYAGWDRSDTDPSFEVGIHHPKGDIMKISRDDDGATKVDAGGTLVWLIGGLSDGIGLGFGWEIGVTEGGSSGSPLFDQNGRIIGQLYGGVAECIGTNDNNDYDLYGRFAISWDDGTNSSTRLKDWLDPLGMNPNTLDALQNTLSVNDEFLDQNISVFPNPTAGVIQVKVSGLVGDLSYEIYNVLGQTLLSNNKLQNNELIDFGNLPNDVYFVKIVEIDTNRSIVKKIVVNK